LLQVTQAPLAVLMLVSTSTTVKFALPTCSNKKSGLNHHALREPKGSLFLFLFQDLEYIKHFPEYIYHCEDTQANTNVV
jgi:hypothetical protein